jgi:hypothetical protein
MKAGGAIPNNLKRRFELPSLVLSRRPTGSDATLPPAHETSAPAGTRFGSAVVASERHPELEGRLHERTTNLPGMTGVALAQALGAIGRPLPVVLITTRGDAATLDLIRRRRWAVRRHATCHATA